MSVYLYEESLVKSLRKITGDGRIHIIDPSRSTQFFAQFDKDKVEYPAIVVSRNSVNLLDYRNQVASIKGQTSRFEEDNTVVKMQLVPIRIEWSIDVFTVDRFSCDEIVRELVFYFIRYPRFEVEVPYQLQGQPQNFDVLLSPDIQDNSDLVEFPNKGEFFRETMTVFTENAHFFSSSRHYPNFMSPDVDTIKSNKEMK